MELESLCDRWKAWSRTVWREADGWEALFPEWDALIAEAARVMTKGLPTEAEVRLLEMCWSISEEDEELLHFAEEHIDECWAVLRRLAVSSDWKVRWQVYEASAAAGRRAEEILRPGLEDTDEYARQRAVLALARVAPDDARALAEVLFEDPAPYIRQAAIELACSVGDREFLRASLERLSHDPVDHVRRQARRKLGEAFDSAQGSASSRRA